MPRDLSDLVGPHEIADRLDVARNTIAMWAQRGWPSNRTAGGDVKAPSVLATISGVAIYSWRDVERWARETNRLPDAPTPPEQGTNQATRGRGSAKATGRKGGAR